MASSDKKRVQETVPVQVGYRHRLFEDLAGQVVSDMRERMEHLHDETGRPVTQAMLAQALEVDRSSISKVLGGEANLTLRKISDFAAATGSRCFFRMVRDPASHLFADSPSNFDENSPKWMMMSGASASKGKKTQRGLTQSGLLDAAREYIESVINKDGVIDHNKGDEFWVGSLEDTNVFWPPFDDNQTKQNGISVTLQKRDGVGNVLMIIVAEFTFADGFSETEWVLYDYHGGEHFRSRDLQQVARIAGVVMSRGGFQV